MPKAINWFGLCLERWLSPQHHARLRKEYGDFMSFYEVILSEAVGVGDTA